MKQHETKDMNDCTIKINHITFNVSIHSGDWSYLFSINWLDFNHHLIGCKYFFLFKFCCLSNRKVGIWNFLCLCFMSITGVNKYKVQHIHRVLCLCEWMWTHEVKQCFELSTMNIWMKLVCFNSLPIVFYSILKLREEQLLKVLAVCIWYMNMHVCIHTKFGWAIHWNKKWKKMSRNAWERDQYSIRINMNEAKHRWTVKQPK